MNIGKYVQMYSEDLKLKNYASNTIDNYSNQVKLFLQHFNDVATKPSEIYTHVSTASLKLMPLPI